MVEKKEKERKGDCIVLSSVENEKKTERLICFWWNTKTALANFQVHASIPGDISPSLPS